MSIFTAIPAKVSAQAIKQVGLDLSRSCCNKVVSKAHRLILGIGLLVLTACAAKKRVSVDVPGALVEDHSYTDLVPGTSLRIVVPIRQEGASVTGDGVKLQGIGGYQIVRYAVKGSETRGVVLQFISAETTRNGKTTSEPLPPDLPLHLPSDRSHIRLVYLIRASSTDHDMAVLSAKHLAELEAFTMQLQSSPAVCNDSGQVRCIWIPRGVAVRPEE